MEKWGGPEELDKEWERREENKVKRKEKKYHDQLREMRKELGQRSIPEN